MNKLLRLIIIVTAFTVVKTIVHFPDAYFGELLFAQTNTNGLDPLPLDEVEFWGYQITDVSAEDSVRLLEESSYDMLVLEPTRTDWSDSGEKQFDTKGMVSRLKNSLASDGIHRKLVIAYIDIGEAEDWRWYWTWTERIPEDVDCSPENFPPSDWPDYIIKCDPDGFSGNYPVAFWDPRWKDIVIFGENTSIEPDMEFNSIIDEVIKDGFDGIYLDWVEAAEDDDIIALAKAQGKDAVDEMITFIQEMKDYAEERNPNFIIIQQNAASIIDGHPELIQVIDAISQEAIWFDGDADVDWEDLNGCDEEVDSDTTDGYLEFLGQYQEASLPVFDCEYACGFAETAYSNALEEGFIPYASRRSLAKLTTTPPSLLPSTSSTPKPEPTPALTPTPDEEDDNNDDKSFTFNCEHSMKRGFFFGLETLTMNVGDQEDCTLRLTNNEPGKRVEISSFLRKGFRSAIKIEPARSRTDVNGELAIIITAINKGKDWAAWAVPNDSEEFKFNKKSYDTGIAWGMFVEVK
ncbi:MAG: endo alpha-1,4 polygalactosaminidase [Candidatus Anammoxibacter sp.]